jgi:hypothetical protein
MKRIFAVLMVLVLGSVSFGISLVANGTSQTIQFMMYDTANARKTGLVYTDFTVTYTIDGAAGVGVTEATLAAVDSAYSSGGIKEIDATNQPGKYRFDVPNAACVVAAGTKRVSITFKATGCNNTDGYYDLTPSVNAVLANGTTMPTWDPTTDTVQLTAVGLNADAATEIADAVSAAVGNVTPPPSGGAVHNGIIDDKALIGNGVYSVTLASTASASNNTYTGMNIVIHSGGYADFQTTITTYTGATKIATLASYPETNRVAADVSTYDIYDATPVGTSGAAILTGTARAQSSTRRIQLASTVNGVPETTIDVYNGYSVRILTGTGAGQIRKIAAYMGHSVTSASDNQAYVEPDFETAPDTTSAYEVFVGPSLPDYRTFSYTVASSGSTKTTAVLDVLIGLRTFNPYYGIVEFQRVYAGSTTHSYHVCTVWNSTIPSVTVYPSFPFTPTSADRIRFISGFSGLLPMDIAKYSGR